MCNVAAHTLLCFDLVYSSVSSFVRLLLSCDFFLSAFCSVSLVVLTLFSHQIGWLLSTHICPRSLHFGSGS